MNRYAQLTERLGPLLLITIVGLWLLWPIPSGDMPLSADHTVHLSRVWLFADQLGQGQLRGWSSAWFFGTPVGELYPVLGDMLIVGLRVLSLGLLDWPTAYALGFTVVFVAQGWAMLRAGKVMGLGPLPGLVAALLILADVGAYREGGWLYTVTYGVWPQTLATALGWLAIAEIMSAAAAEEAKTARRGVALGALALGGALLAHPMSMLFIAIAGPIAVVTAGGLHRVRLRRAAGTGILIAGLGLALSAWWLFPMLSHRGWMASYGWLWHKLPWLIEHAKNGEWAQDMPGPVGWTAMLGLLLTTVIGSRAARAFGATALVLWIASAADLTWWLRLDLVSEGFSQVQYQRLLTAAKPGFFLMVGAAFGFAAKAAGLALKRNDRRARVAAAGVALAAVGLGYWVGDAQQLISRTHKVGEVQTQRSMRSQDFERDYAELIAWLDGQWGEREGFYRFTVRDDRNVHWFMDATALASGVPIFKQGFTPGDNFVHKPESGRAAVLDRARARYEIRRGRIGGTEPVARFGTIAVREREGWEANRVAWVDGAGDLEVLASEADGGDVRVRVTGTEEGSRLVFGIAGFPRWQLTREGEPVSWYEAPVIGDGGIATQSARRFGELRGGKAHGDDGTEPTLIAADAVDGEYTLTYERWRAVDVLALLISLGGALAVFGCLWRPQRFSFPTLVIGRTRERLGRAGNPLVLGTAVLALVIGSSWRVRNGRFAEQSQAIGWVDGGFASAPRRMRAGYLKIDMLIRPAVVVRRGGEAIVSFEGLTMPAELTGWVGLDDDHIKARAGGKHSLRIEARPSGGEWTTLLQQRVTHRQGRHEFALPAEELEGVLVDVRVTVTSEGKSPPPVGFDLNLGAANP